MKVREDGMELWLLMVISTNRANSFLAQAGRPQSPETLTYLQASELFPFSSPKLQCCAIYADGFPYSIK